MDARLAASVSPIATRRTPRPLPEEVRNFYPLDSVGPDFPADVDARIEKIVNCPGQVHIAWCQWVSA